MATPCLWGSRAAKCLKSSVFKRPFSSVVKDSQYVSTHEEVEDDSHGKENSTPKKKVNAFFRTYHGLGVFGDGIHTTGSNLYLGEVDDGIYHTRKKIRIPHWAILFHIDDETGTILKALGTDDYRGQDYQKIIAD